ncbi:ArdC family protein [Sphingosinithalassobacter portus]|uniref:ArdC family protein n=1 Tax=Stakelama portus TaxID=2676234 RepID=UPI000D6EA919|nr:zincin-like metallopeptidase domain-containing protein [Sphingosinithalassobacter portus]
MGTNERQSLYGEVTNRIIAELEEGRLPWVQPWDACLCPCTMPHNAGSGRTYSGINVLILWASVIEHGHALQGWLTYRQAEKAGGHVRRGEKGTVICYADRFTPRDEAEKARSEDREARTIAFLKRFTVFNVDQCEGLPEAYFSIMDIPDPVLAIAAADEVIAQSGADLRVGGGEAFYAPREDFVQVPPQAAFGEPINWYRTALHELGHWTGHSSRLNRDQTGAFGYSAYAREELVAEMASAFTCASLGIEPTVRHADYIGAWLSVLRGDEKAIFRAASAASKAADWLLASRAAEAGQ